MKRVVQMRQIKTITHAIYYLLGKIKKPADKMKIVKLMFLADKYHLLHYGRTITDDDFVALEHGPVGSMTLNVLNCKPDDFNISKEACRYISQHIEIIDNIKRSIGSIPPDFKSLSESDKIALDFIIDNFGKMSTGLLREYTHKYPEWKQYESDFEQKQTQHENIDTEEMFSCLDGDPLAVDTDLIEMSKDVFYNLYE